MISNNKKILAIISTLSLISFSNLTIKNIEIKNLKQLDKEYIKQLLPVKEGDKYSNKQLTDIYKKLLKNSVVQDIVITPKIENDDVDIAISIDEKPNAKDILDREQAIREAQQKTNLIINDVRIEGLNNVDKKEVEELLNTDTLKQGSYFIPYNVEIIKAKIGSTGYFETVESEVIRNAKNKTVDIVYKVKENPIVRSVSIGGSRMFLEKDLIKASKIEEGKVLNVNYLNQETMPLLDLYRDLGVVAARVKDINVSKDGDVFIELTEGKIGNISFKKVVQRKDGERRNSNNSYLKTQDFVFNRALAIKRGDTLTKEGIDSSLRELQRTGLFTSIVPEIKPTNNDILDVDFLVTERSTTSLNASATYSPLEGGLVGGLTLKDSNFLGRNQEMSLNTNISTRGNLNFSFNFSDPWIRGTDKVQAGFVTNVARNIILSQNEYKKIDKEVEELDKKIKEAKTQEEKQSLMNSKKSKIRDKVAKPYIRYSYTISGNVGKGLGSDFYINIKPQIQGVYEYNHDNKKIEDYTTFSILPSIIYDTRDNTFIPKKGFYFQVTNELGYLFRNDSYKFQQKPSTDGFSVDDYEYLPITSKKTGIYDKIEADFRAYHPLYKDINSMAYRLVVGYATDLAKQTFSSDGTFFRGQPTTPSGNEKFVLSIENRTYISQYVQSVLFFDFGNIYDSSNRAKAWSLLDPVTDGSRTGLKISFGAGIRVNTPLGIIRLDYGWPIEKSKYTNRYSPGAGSISFGFGQTF